MTLLVCVAPPQGKPCLTLPGGRGTCGFVPVYQCHKLLKTPGCRDSLTLEFTCLQKEDNVRTRHTGLVKDFLKRAFQCIYP